MRVVSISAEVTRTVTSMDHVSMIRAAGSTSASVRSGMREMAGVLVSLPPMQAATSSTIVILMLSVSTLRPMMNSFVG